MKEFTTTYVKNNVHSVDSVSKKDGVFTARRGFFYTHGHTAREFAERVKQQLESPKVAVEIVDCGEVWKSFRGGASTANQSHWWVKFRMTEVKV